MVSFICRDCDTVVVKQTQSGKRNVVAECYHCHRRYEINLNVVIKKKERVYK